MTRYLSNDSGIGKTLTEVTSPKSTESTNSTMPAYLVLFYHAEIFLSTKKGVDICLFPLYT